MSNAEPKKIGAWHKRLYNYPLAMIPLSYRSPKTEVRESKIHGRGLFASDGMAKDEIVAVKGGHIINRNTLREKITPALGPVEIQIADDLMRRFQYGGDDSALVLVEIVG